GIRPCISGDSAQSHYFMAGKEPLSYLLACKLRGDAFDVDTKSKPLSNSQPSKAAGVREIKAETANPAFRKQLRLALPTSEENQPQRSNIHIAGQNLSHSGVSNDERFTVPIEVKTFGALYLVR